MLKRIAVAGLFVLVAAAPAFAGAFAVSGTGAAAHAGGVQEQGLVGGGAQLQVQYGVAQAGAESGAHAGLGRWGIGAASGGIAGAADYQVQYQVGYGSGEQLQLQDSGAGASTFSAAGISLFSGEGE
jgi:hypothetical protein